MTNYHRNVRSCLAVYFALVVALAGRGQDDANEDLFGDPFEGRIESLEHDESVGSFFRSESANEEWRITVGSDEELPGELPPDRDFAAELHVEWLPATIDAIGAQVTIHGRLKTPSKTDPSRFEPINWSQPITVAVQRKPLVEGEPHVPLVLTSDDSATQECTSSAKGEFSVQIELDLLDRNKRSAHRFRVAIALGVRKTRKNSGPVLKWTSSDTILKQTMVAMEIPANPQIDPVIEAIHLACKDEFDSLAIIRAVNLMQPLGKELALQRIEDYLEAKGEAQRFIEPDGLFWLLRLTFEPLEFSRRIPRPRAIIRGVSDSVEADWPLNPLVVVSDVPFRFIGGGIGGSGMPEEPSSHIEYVRRHCVIRDAPLHPRADPILIAQQIIDSPLVTKMREFDRKQAITDIRSQAWAMLPKDRLNRLTAQDEEARWLETLAQSQEQPVRWSDANRFQE